MIAIPQAAAITNALTEGGFDEAATAWWYRCPRRELAGLSPGAALALDPAAADSVLDLARADAELAGAMPEIGSIWINRERQDAGAYTVTGERPARPAPSGGVVPPEVVCRRRGERVIVPLRAFWSGGHMRPAGGVL